MEIIHLLPYLWAVPTLATAAVLYRAMRRRIFALMDESARLRDEIDRLHRLIGVTEADPDPVDETEPPPAVTAAPELPMARLLRSRRRA